MKICIKCKILKPLTEFYKRTKSKDQKCSQCKSCKREANHAWQKKDPEHARAVWRAEHKKYYTTKRGRLRKIKSYGITENEYHILKDFAHGNCHICHEPFGNQENIDHCHKTNNVRGLLCTKCNIALGALNDNIALLQRAIEYIEQEGFCKYKSTPEIKESF